MWILGSRIGRALLAVLAAVAAVLAYGKAKKREGAKDAISDAKEADTERAGEIRDRVDAVRRDPVRVRPNDKRGYRD